MAAESTNNGYILGIDYGQRYIGLALASPVAKLPRPLVSVENTDIYPKLQETIRSEDVSTVVVGLPKNLEGKDTKQTQIIRQFAEDLKKQLNVDVILADEALSSVRAQEYIQSHKSENNDIDSIAACFILEEYFAQIAEGRIDG